MIPHLLRYQGFAVDYYGFTLDALSDDTSAEWGKKTAESLNRYNAAMDDLETEFKEKGHL